MDRWWERKQLRPCGGGNPQWVPCAVVAMYVFSSDLELLAALDGFPLALAAPKFCLFFSLVSYSLFLLSILSFVRYLVFRLAAPYSLPGCLPPEETAEFRLRIFIAPEAFLLSTRWSFTLRSIS